MMRHLACNQRYNPWHSPYCRLGGSATLAMSP